MSQTSKSPGKSQVGSGQVSVVVENKEDDVNFDVVELIKTVVADLMYNSFDAVRIRKGLYDLLTFRQIIVLVSAYCQIGNNVNKANRPKVIKQHPEVVTYLSKSGTTLARVGSAFAALVYHIRKNLKDKFQVRVKNCNTPFEFQDPALAPYHQDGRDFYNRFSILIGSTNSKTDYYELARANLDEHTKDLLTKSFDDVIKGIKDRTY
jgi:hypothetical protein